MASTTSASPPSAPACTAIRSKKRRESRSKPSPRVLRIPIARCEMFPWCCSTRAPTQYTRASRRSELLLQKLLNRFDGLPGPMLIFDQGEADVAFTQRPESDARRYGDQCFFQQQFREFERALGAVLLRNRRPNEHRAARGFHRPASLMETGNQEIPAFLVNRADLLGILGAFT